MCPAMDWEKSDIDTPGKREKCTVSVVGCGRIGLPTALIFADAGFRVMGVDTNPQVVNLLTKGKAPFDESGMSALLKKNVKNGRFSATTDIRKASSESDVVILVVPTPIDQRKKPDYSSVEKPCKDVGLGLRRGSIVIIASTTGPGITETLVKETLENSSGLKAGVDFGLACSPTRAAPGRILSDIASYARVVGAINKESLRAAGTVLGAVVKGGIVEVKDMRTAEAVKLFENVYRDVSLALANELGQLCEKVGIDFLEAQKAANTQPYCHLLVPGIVSGHIPKDPYLLVEEAENANVKLRMLLLARKINDEMVAHTVRLTMDALKNCGKTLRRARITVLGVSYRANIKEPRGSSTRQLVDLLRTKGATVRVYDPLYSFKEMKDMGYPTERTLTGAVEGADCLIFVVGHDRFKRLNLRRIRFLMRKSAALVDVGHVIEVPLKAEKESFVYRGVGRGVWSK